MKEIKNIVHKTRPTEIWSVIGQIKVRKKLSKMGKSYTVVIERKKITIYSLLPLLTGACLISISFYDNISIHISWLHNKLWLPPVILCLKV
jgi:hypothetical protein